MGVGTTMEYELVEPFPYDAVLVLDADNLVTPNTLKVLNQRIVSGAEKYYLYLDSKNHKR
ncbi:hypothetical protein P7H06_15170 [Paenibacillus larvae]|nr:hypothetical protein [Paenibacillus larvae]MDT2260570.1 hypothetical protein [Paenibacillus larvae]